jgi:hypothetical protein
MAGNFADISKGNFIPETILFVTNQTVSVARQTLFDTHKTVSVANKTVALTETILFVTNQTLFVRGKTALGTLTTGLRTAMAVAASGGPQATAAKDKAFAALADALQKDAHYVEIQANHDLETALSSGFNVVSTNRAPAPLDAPVIVDIENLASTQFLLRLNPMANVRSFQVQTSTDGKTWTEAGIYTQSRRIVLMGLTPAITYYARVRAIGGSTGRSDWSVPASLMAT